MAQATIALPAINTLADLAARLGGIPLDRIRFRPPPGTATEKDVIEAEARDNRLCELVDGTLVEKAVGFEEARLAGRLVHLRLDGGDVLPGFVVPLADFLDRGRRPRGGLTAAIFPAQGDHP